MQKAAPTPEPGSRKPMTLLDYFSTETFVFSLVNKDGHLFAVEEYYDPQIHDVWRPRVRILDVLQDSTNAARPQTSRDERIAPSIRRSELPDVPLIPATELVRVEDGMQDEEMSDMPRKVRWVKSNEVYFFKPLFKDHGYPRELKTLSQISHCGKFEAPFRTSKLVGLVSWDDNNHLMGFILDFIDGKSLKVESETASLEDRRKWVEQVEATVRRLHEADVVWGDAKPDNVMINADGNAVVVDFGGGYSPEYVPSELQQTIQGDLIALDRMKGALNI